VETVATPFLYAAFLPLTSLDFESAHRTYSGVSLLAFLAGVALLARSAGFQMPAAAVVAGVLGLSFAPLVSDLVVGNMNSLQLALVATPDILRKSQRDSRRALKRTLKTLRGALTSHRPEGDEADLAHNLNY
jgi:hypothetical protein